MTSASSVNKIYAIATCDIAEKSGTAQKVLDDFQFIQECFTGNPFLLQWLSFPSINKKIKTNILESAFESKVDPLTLRILRILVRNSRMNLLVELYDALKNEMEERSSAVKVILTSAIPLDDSLKKAYNQKINKKLNREVKIEYVIDKSLIGGCRIKYEGKIIDCSISTELNKLRNLLTIE